MSHHKVKSIKIENGKVFITGKCNNDTEPIRQRHFDYFDEYFSEGIEKVELQILKAFEEGNFQSATDNKWTRAIRSLRAMPAYTAFDWRIRNYDHKEQDAEIEANRNSSAFEELLLLALKTPIQKEKIIVSKDYFGKTVYLHKKTRSGVRWHESKAAAKVFNYMQDVKNLLASFTNGSEWKIETV